MFARISVSIVSYIFNRNNFHYIYIISIILFSNFDTALAAQCGYANGNSYSSAPRAVASLCSTGTASTVSGAGPWNWTCSDSGGPVSCRSDICGVTFDWDVGTFSNCSASCGGGSQSRSVICMRSDGLTAADADCPGSKPATSRACNTQACAPTYTYAWSTGVFGACSSSCGGGSQTRSVTCQRNDGVSVADSYCSGSKPAASQACNTQACVVACLPTAGELTYEGQTQCPTNECFVWAGGVGGSNRSDDTTQNQTYRQLIGEIRFDSSLFGRGDYTYTHGTNTQYVPGTRGPFYKPATRSLDTVALGPKTRLIVYDAPDFAGNIIANETGPAVILNSGLGVNPADSSSTRNYWNNIWATENWSATGGLLVHFPPSTRKKTASPGVLWGWTKHNPLYYPQSHGETSIKVECLP